METKKIIIFGAGISGATIARKFADIGYDVIIYEKKKEIGGNCFDYKNKHGVLVHKFGPHIFHTNSEEVYEFINRFDKLNNFINKVQVSVNNIRFPIPINFKSIEIIFPNDAKYIITTLKKIFQDKKTITLFELEEIQDKKIKLLYNYVYKNVFANYTAKMWGKNIEEIDKNTINRIKIVLGYGETYFPEDKYQGLPQNGYTNLIKKIITHKNIKIITNSKIKLVFKNKKIYINNKEVIFQIIYCGLIDELFNFKYGELPFRSLQIKTENFNKENYQDNAVINYPAHKTMTRITEYKKMTKQNIINKTSISKEFPGEYDKKSKKFNTPFYPIINDSTAIILKKYFEETSKYKNLFLLGRLAQYKYYDMDDAMLAAFELFNKIVVKKTK